jgi:hypothetical protein
MFEEMTLLFCRTNSFCFGNFITKQRVIEFSTNQLGVLGVEMEGSYYQRNHSIGFKMQKSVPHDIKD